MRVAAALLAIATPVAAQQYVFRAWRQADGLKNLGLRSLATDCHGFVWVATENGVFRFLGSGFEHFGPDQGITELGIQEIATDRACNVWVGTTHNFYRFDGQRFVQAAASPLRLRDPHDLAVEDERHVLVVDSGHLVRLEHDAQGKALTLEPAAPAGLTATSLGSVSVAGDRVWVGAGTKLDSWSTDGKNAVTEWGRAQGLPDDHWESVVVDGRGTVWAEGWTHVAALPKGATEFVDRSLPLSAQGSYFLRARLMVDPEGRVLAPTDEGVARWEDNHWHTINRASGLPSNNPIAGMTFDGTGDLWLGSYGDGLYQWAGYAAWEGWNDSERLPSLIIWALDASRPGRVLVGTDKGPAWIDTANGPASGAVSGAGGALAKGPRWTPGWIVAMGREGDGSEWIATNSGNVVTMRADTGAVTHTAKVPASVVSGFEDSAGRLFLGTDHGIFEREAGGGAFTPVTAAHGLIDDGVPVNGGCQAPDGADWFLAGNRLVREKAGVWSKPELDGLPGAGSGRLIALSCARDGSLWVTGERIGTWRVRAAGERLQAWHLVPPADLGAVEAYAILADRRGWIWLGTDQGLFAWNGKDWRHETQESGMLWSDVDEWGLQEGVDGSLWVGTSGGVAHLLHPERIFDPVALPVSLTAMQRGNEDYLLQPHLGLAWSPLPLRFQISSPLVRNRSELVFRYQMEGLHSGWIESEDGQAVLSGLSPGSYTFEAMAVNPGLQAKSDVVRMHVTIHPPWWRDPWLLSLDALVLLVVAFIAMRKYGRHLRARSLLLEALVRERTRELEASREQLRIQATHDALTGMLNRAAILRDLEQEMDRARREGRTLILAITDIDHFKNVNDRCGHLAGDEALRSFAEALRMAIRTYDRVGRYGGEEFLLVLTEVPAENAERRLLQLHAAISNLRVQVRDAELTITCSIGASVFDPLHGAADIEALLSVADQALYAAKDAGRNCVVFRRAEAAAETGAKLSGV